MYVGKRNKSILSVFLICGILVVSVPCRVYAAVPVALGPALKYAIGAGIVAGGLYAADSDSLKYVVEDYWSKANEHVKNQWKNALVYGTGVGILVLNDTLNKDIKRYLDNSFSKGDNTVTLEPTSKVSAEKYKEYDLEGYYIYGMALTVGERTENYYPGEYGEWSFSYPILLGGNLLTTIGVRGGEEVLGYYIKDITITLTGKGDIILKTTYDRYPASDWVVEKTITKEVIASLLGISVNDLTHEWGEVTKYELVGDALGFGNATEGRPDIKIPCPPVPAEEWPDSWLDNLEEELNLAGNPALDDETSIEEWEEEWEWYLDENGNIYKVKKGEPPKKPDDEPIRIPGPPLPGPDIPENYPTEDNPDITIEHYPPEKTVTEHPDGSRTETTTQTTRTTKKWWDPYSKRWRTTTTDTTTTTIVDYAPDGTETGRTTTTTTQPKGEREETAQPDDTAINWEPLRRGLYELTEKFPFCLPWDLMRGIQSLESNQWDRQIRINVGDGIWPEMVIDLTMFDEIAAITRVILLIVFDLGLIFGTRRLMGGDV